MADVKGALTHKFGPLPAWAWGVAIGGSVILFRVVTGKGAFPAASSGGGAAVGASGQAVQPIIPGSEQSALSQLSSSDLAILRDYLRGGPDDPLKPIGFPTDDPIFHDTRWRGWIPAPPDSGPAAPIIGSGAPIPKAGGSTGPVGAPSGGSNVYFAKAGDTLDAIAARFNIAGGGNALYALNPNNVTGRYDVKAGQGITLWM